MAKERRMDFGDWCTAIGVLALSVGAIFNSMGDIERNAQTAALAERVRVLEEAAKGAARD